MEKPKPPEKPANYWLIYTIIVVVSLITGLVLIYFDIPSAVGITVILVTLGPHLCFRQYYAEYTAYEYAIGRKKRIENVLGPRVVPNSQVNKNIQRFRAAQRSRK